MRSLKLALLASSSKDDVRVGPPNVFGRASRAGQAMKTHREKLDLKPCGDRRRHAGISRSTSALRLSSLYFLSLLQHGSNTGELRCQQ
jgi:hypothetical protein